MKILLAASDLTPLIAPDESIPTDAVSSLALALQRAGHEVSLAGPLWPTIEKSGLLKIKPTRVRINVPLGAERQSVEVREARSSQGLQLFFFAHEGTFGQSPDAPTRAPITAAAATLFSKLIVELARRLNPAPDVVHVLDWPGTLAPVFLKAQHLPFACVLSASDPTAQGSFPIEDFGLLNLGWEYFRPTEVEFYGRVNFLKAGILAADAIVTDGDLERHALLTPEHGGGLDVVFRENAARLHGIPAGLDEQTWNPATDGILPKKYRPASLAGKEASRAAFLAQLGLDKNPAGPVFLLDFTAPQDRNYLELLAGKLDQLLADDVRVAVLGAFPDKLPAEITFQIAAKKYPQKLALARDVNDRLTHLALAGSDFQLFLGRSRGLSTLLLRSLKYGAVPIAPAGPGLKQIIDDYQPDSETGHGVIFYLPERMALFDALAHRAPALLEPPDRWESLRQRAMIHAAKFSWARSAAQHVALYQQVRR